MTHRPQDELSLAWSDHDYAMGARAGWNAAVAYMEIHVKREIEPVPTRFLEHIDRTASEAFAIIAKAKVDQP